MSLAPNAISDLELWLDADAISGLSDGDTVVTWADQSGNGNDYTNATPTAGITYETGELNGMPVVRFPNPNGGLSGPVSLVSPFSVFYVAKSNQGGAGGTAVVNPAGEFWFIGTNSGTWWYRAGAHELSTGVSAAAGDWVAHGAIQEVLETREEVPLAGGFSYVYDLDTNAVPTVVSLLRATDPGAFLIGGAPGFGFGGDIAEIVAYSRNLSVTERVGLTDYFREKWGGIVASSAEDTDIDVLIAQQSVLVANSNDAAARKAQVAREAVVVPHHFPEANTSLRLARHGVVVAISRPHGWDVFDDPPL